MKFQSLGASSPVHSCSYACYQSASKFMKNPIPQLTCKALLKRDNVAVKACRVHSVWTLRDKYEFSSCHLRTRHNRAKPFGLSLKESTSYETYIMICNESYQPQEVTTKIIRTQGRPCDAYPRNIFPFVPVAEIHVEKALCKMG